MSWILPSLIAPALFTLVVFVDKDVLTHRVKDSHAMPLYSAIVATAIGALLWLLDGHPTPPLPSRLLLLGAGFISLFGYALYFHTLAQNHASYVVALLQTKPLLTLLLSLTLLGQALSLPQLLGFSLVLLATLGLSIDDETRRIRVNDAFFTVLLANALFAVSSILVKGATDVHDFVPLLAYESWGLGLGGIVLAAAHARTRHALVEVFRTASPSTLSLLSLNESIYIAATGLTLFAIAHGPVALVAVLGGTQVFYGFALGLGLTQLFPHWLREATSTRTDLLRKLSLAIALFAGVVMLARP